MVSLSTKLFSGAVLFVAILVGLTRAPWQEFQQVQGEIAMIDFMEQQYEKYAKQNPLPPVVQYKARDGSGLAIRLYEPPLFDKFDKNGTSIENCKFPNVILHHGSALDGASFHPLATKLQQFGMAVYVPDIRGHGGSIPSGEGDLDYMWQNLDDLEDLLLYFDLDPSCTFIVGHSAQGGGLWHMASQKKWRNKFAGFVPVAAMMGLHPEFIRGTAASNFVSVNLARIISISILNTMGITWFNHQQTTRFFKKIGVKGVDDYHNHCTYNLGISHGPMFALDYKTIVAYVPEGTRVLSISAGSDEALADLTPVLQPLSTHLEHATLSGATHMGILFEEKLANKINDFVGKASAAAAL
mmetsp:Transcript_10837/g.12264  ORF Transcript_10837/g.12264 Transcript_10837/m.12264 type:complete len:355 (-) Transcript_10837:274-1338(-)|eukprot:CAMPEP_0170839876 /NCGR_PEP_ID=MMETSP0734-20130129/4241_1 /TAXON_ID=186038 /ORGANISM="Fragilariopsis kerguelensis, Strain L26-C5" /LENGTH=354 /DNA_ID=CAMNT_0011207573 /DNA_START=289 /DNA_END=1353 /DNA_ORIENTATION=+